MTSSVDFLRLTTACLRGVVTVFVFVLFVRTFLAEGLLTRFVISGTSMSPTLHGTHFLLHCPECATTFCVEAEEEAMTSPQDRPLRLGICPACSFASVPVPADAQRPGNRIVINRAALSLRSIRRWDVVLFHSPDDGELTVKRVVGLPGETLEIRDGNIVINGHIAVKPLVVQRAMRIPVPYGRWEMQEHKCPLSDVCGSLKSPVYELAYHPIRNAPHNGEWQVASDESVAWDLLRTTRPTTFFGVTNQLCENQWRIEPPGGIFPVRDLMLEFDWQPDDSMPLGVRVVAENQQWIMPLSLHKNGMSKVEVSLFGRRLLVAVDGVVISELQLDEASQRSTEASLFAIGIRGNVYLSLSEQEVAIKRQIANLRVYRDVYYITGFKLQASGKSHELPAPKSEVRNSKPGIIPTGCYYVLGDNSSFSSDSRHWKEPFVSYRQLIGIVATN